MFAGNTVSNVQIAAFFDDEGDCLGEFVWQSEFHFFDKKKFFIAY